MSPVIFPQRLGVLSLAALVLVLAPLSAGWGAALVLEPYRTR
jgi:hypothetical protein